MNMLATGAEWLAARRKEFASVQVSYQRGANSVTLMATPGRSQVAATMETQEVRSREREWIITTADLILGGAVTTPVKGDRVVEASGGKVYTWTVLPADGEKEWRYCDSYRNSLRAFCKLTGITDAV